MSATTVAEVAMEGNAGEILLRTALNRHLPRTYIQIKMINIIPYTYSTAPSSNPLLPAVVSLIVVVLLLITCVALLVLVLAVTATKLNKLRAVKAHTDPPHYYNQTAVEGASTTEKSYEEMEEWIGPVVGQSGPYQELELGGMEERQYESLNKDTTADT